MSSAVEPGLFSLSRAELIYMLSGWPDEMAAPVRGKLRITPTDSADLKLAGMTSLTDRGLLVGSNEPEPTGPLKVVLWGLASATTWVELSTMINGELGGAIVFIGPNFNLAMVCLPLGRFRVGMLNLEMPIDEQLADFLERSIADRPDSLGLLRVSDNRGGLALVGVALDDMGAWHVSDSVETPGKAIEVDRGRMRSMVGNCVRTVVGPSSVGGSRPSSETAPRA